MKYLSEALPPLKMSNDKPSEEYNTKVTDVAKELSKSDECYSFINPDNEAEIVSMSESSMDMLLKYKGKSPITKSQSQESTRSLTPGRKDFTTAYLEKYKRKQDETRSKSSDSELNISRSLHSRSSHKVQSITSLCEKAASRNSVRSATNLRELTPPIGPNKKNFNSTTNLHEHLSKISKSLI